jgi:hypothetical protein
MRKLRQNSINVFQVMNYAQLRSYARGFISVFGSTYLCEKTFSGMKYVKSPYRSALTDEHLQSILMIGSTNFEPQFGEICSQKNKFPLIKLYFKQL